MPAVTRPTRSCRTKESDLVKSTLIMQLSAAIFMLCQGVASARAQDTARSGRLYDELARMDHELFEAAFVSCDQA
jgi:hypothetical protein